MFAQVGRPLCAANDVWNCFYRAVKNAAPGAEVSTGGTGAFPTSAQITSAESTDRFNLDSAVGTYHITNADLGRVTVIAYYCTPRRDLPNVSSLWIANSLQNGFQAAGMTTPGGITSPAGSGTATLSPHQLSTTPFMSPNFCRNYKIYAKKKFVMNPGATMTLSIKNKRPRRFSGSYLFPEETSTDTAGLPMWAIGNYTKFILFSVNGQPVHDATTKEVSTSDARLDIVYTRRYEFSKYPARTTKTWDHGSSTTYGGVAMGTITNEEFITPAVQSTTGESG